MRSSLEEAEVHAEEVSLLEPSMADDARDRHVPAAAVAGDAGIVAAADLIDVPESACEAAGVVAQHPEAFLHGGLLEHADAVVAVVREQFARDGGLSGSRRLLDPALSGSSGRSDRNSNM